MSSLEIVKVTRPLSGVMITSAQPEEGKTTVTVNLELTLMGPARMCSSSTPI